MDAPIPKCPTHPRAKVMSVRVNPLGERAWFCLVCNAELGAAPPGETIWTTADHRRHHHAGGLKAKNEPGWLVARHRAGAVDHFLSVVLVFWKTEYTYEPTPARMLTPTTPMRTSQNVDGPCDS